MTMKLIDLEPAFLGKWDSGESTSGRPSFYELGDNQQGAQGIRFWCPKCQGHAIICWFKNPCGADPVPTSAFPGPGRWDWNGQLFERLSLTPSVDISRIDDENPAHPSRCYWHGFVTDGIVT